MKSEPVEAQSTMQRNKEYKKGSLSTCTSYRSVNHHGIYDAKLLQTPKMVEGI
nr:hypothetical protein Iba_chr14dCG11580 [Ipomoea batatas]